MTEVVAQDDTVTFFNKNTPPFQLVPTCMPKVD